MSSRYFYADANSQPVGPLSLDEIRRFVVAGVVLPDVMVCEAGGEDWKPLHSFHTSKSAPPPMARPASTPVANDPERTAHRLHLHLSHAIVAVIFSFFVNSASGSAASSNGVVDPNGVLQLFAVLTALWALATELVLIFRICRALPNHLRFTTPAKAAWFTIIPGFNIYWAFRLLPGFAEAAVKWDREADSNGSDRKPAPVWLLPVAYVSASFVAVSTVLMLLEILEAIPFTGVGSLIYAINYGMSLTVYATVVSVIRGILAPEQVEGHSSMELTDDGKTPKFLLWWCNYVWPTIWGCLMAFYFIVMLLKHFGVVD